jgi:hypothetical protein
MISSYHSESINGSLNDIEIIPLTKSPFAMRFHRPCPLISIKLLLIVSMAHLFCNVKNKREAPKIRENEVPGNSIEKIQNEGFHSCHNASLYSSSSPSMALQDLAKGINTQRRR